VRRIAIALAALVTGAGLVTATPAAHAADQPAITVASPSAGQRISSPVTISGTANTFESTVLYRIRDERGTELAFGFTSAGHDGYIAKVPYLVAADQPGTIEVFWYSPKGDDPVPVEMDKVTVPVFLTARPQDGIVVFGPETGERVYSPVRVTGKARAFEGTLFYRIRDQHGTEIVNGMTTAENDGDEQDPFRGSFAVDIKFKVRAVQPGRIELWEPNMSDEGPRELYLVTVPVILAR
jgi:hypothetical protein